WISMMGKVMMIFLPS
ncbi:hypothetical protein C359_06709, partial [Cryptococcus neoformans Bt120]